MRTQHKHAYILYGQEHRKKEGSKLFIAFSKSA
jgi:hypothetical protein